MNLICPSCGQAGNETIFRKIGQKKLLCTNCKAVLKIALKCPACDAIIEMPFIIFPVIDRFNFVYGIKRIIGGKAGLLTCPVCHFRGITQKFDRIAVFNEEYSIII